MPARKALAAPRRVPLAAAGAHARLVFYPPGLRQAAHRHERTHVSIIIGGAIREVSPGRDETGVVSALILRPKGSTHQVEFGPQGALILAVDVEERLTRTATSRWLHRSLSSVQRTLLHSLLIAGAAREDDVGDCIEDLLAGIETESLRGAPPAWLVRARERLTMDPAGARIEALARAAGVHRAHFARAFQHWFKAPPSLFRRRAMLSEAIAAMASGESIAAAAQRAGFADQSHLCRSMRSAIGVTPGRLLRRA